MVAYAQCLSVDANRLARITKIATRSTAELTTTGMRESVAAAGGGVSVTRRCMPGACTLCPEGLPLTSALLITNTAMAVPTNKTIGRNRRSDFLGGIGTDVAITERNVSTKAGNGADAGSPSFRALVEGWDSRTLRDWTAAGGCPSHKHLDSRSGCPYVDFWRHSLPRVTCRKPGRRYRRA